MASIQRTCSKKAEVLLSSRCIARRAAPVGLTACSVSRTPRPGASRVPSTRCASSSTSVPRRL
eukprot:11173631-Lingulodinium_polyedra.AAC.1